MPSGGLRIGAPRPARCGHLAPYTGGVQRKYCEDCKPQPGKCAQCDVQLLRRNAKFCSARCREIQYGQRLSAPLPERECAYCGESFRPMFRHQQCCSEMCGKRRWKQEAKLAGKLKPQPWDDKRRDNYHRRRALKLAASTGERVLRDEIAERDRYKCGLCGLAVVMTIAWPNPQSPSIDHIIPLSRGGSHDPSNCQLAHLECNTSKGARMAEAA